MSSSLGAGSSTTRMNLVLVLLWYLQLWCHDLAARVKLQTFVELCLNPELTRTPCSPPWGTTCRGSSLQPPLVLA